MLHCSPFSLLSLSSSVCRTILIFGVTFSSPQSVIVATFILIPHALKSLKNKVITWNCFCMEQNISEFLISLGLDFFLIRDFIFIYFFFFCLFLPSVSPSLPSFPPHPGLLSCLPLLLDASTLHDCCINTTTLKVVQSVQGLSLSRGGESSTDPSCRTDPLHSPGKAIRIRVQGRGPGRGFRARGRPSVAVMGVPVLPCVPLEYLAFGRARPIPSSGANDGLP